MTTLHVHFALHNQQAFQRLLDGSRTTGGQSTSGPALSTSGGRSWTKRSPLSSGPPVPPCDVNARDWLGRTVLHLAVSSLDPVSLEFVKLLLSHPRIDVNIPDLESRWTALHRALYCGNIPACVLLLQRADIDVSLKDFEGYTAFDVYNSTVEGTKPDDTEVTDLYTWGTNRNAALGVSDGDDRTFPELVPIPPQKDHADASTLPLRSRFQPIRAKRIAMAKLHTAVITSEPRANLRICGFGSGGRLGAGMGQHTQYALSTPKDLASEAQIVAIALGQDHTLVLTSSGSVLSWGLARFSQLGYALDGGQTLQATPRRIVGPLKKEIVVGVAACRTASACWTRDELFTWGTNSGQLGYDRAGTPVQVSPRRVTQATLPVVGLALSDAAMAVLLSSRDVHCFQNGRTFKINFPTQSFPSEIQVYRPPMAQNNASIAKVVNCDNTFAALSSNGEVFTFTFSDSPPILSSDPNAPSAKGVGIVPVKPQRIWALRKQISAVKDVALGSDGTILLCTESGHVYLRSRTNKTSKFTRIPLLQRVVSVAASSAGSFAALKADCCPTPTILEGNSVAEDLGAVQPYLLRREDERLSTGADGSSTQLPKQPSIDHTRLRNSSRDGSDPEFEEDGRSSTGTDDSSTQLPKQPSIDHTVLRNSSMDGSDLEFEEDTDMLAIREDVSMIRSFVDLLTRDVLQRNSGKSGIFAEIDPAHGADLLIEVDPIFAFPAHRVVLASRSQVLNDILLGERIGDPGGRLRCYIVEDRPQSFRQVMMLSGVHPLSALLLSEYLYTDKIPAIWDRRVSSLLSDSLAECSPRTDALSIRNDLQSLSALLQLPALSEALNVPVKRPLEPRLTHDVNALLDSNLRTVHPAPHPLAPDTILKLSDAHMRCHSTILRARSPFFAAFFDDPEWTANRRQQDGTLVVSFEHRRQRVMEYILRFIYTGGDEELFDVLDFVQSTNDILEFLFEVVDAAGELLLDRLILSCSSVILQFLDISNACSILSDASHFNVKQLVSSIHGYLARNLETLLESRMLDDLPVNLLRQLSGYVRARQAEKLPVTRSGKMIQKALEAWKDWLVLQDIPQVVFPTRKSYIGHVRHSPRLSPEATGVTTRRKQRPSTVQLSASYSPPQDLHLPITPPSAPTKDLVESAPDDVFVMDDIQDIPPLNLSNTPDNPPIVTERDPAPASGTTYSPWKARISQLPSSKLDLRVIMAEAEGQRKASLSTDSHTPPRPRVVGFDSSASAQSSRPSQDGDSFRSPLPMKAGPSSPWQTSKAGPPMGHQGAPAVGNTLPSRKPSGSQNTATGSGLSRDLRENPATGTHVFVHPDTASATSRQGQASLGKGKSPFGPTFAPSRQTPLPVGAVPITRRVSEGTSKAWSTAQMPSTPPASQENAMVPSMPPSFLAIQQQQQNQNAGPTRVKKSLLEIQAEEESRIAEERAVQEEIEFMRWWAAEEDRIRRETQAQPGPPVSVPGGSSKGGRKERGKGTRGPRKSGQADKKFVSPSGQTGSEGEDKRRKAAATANQKGGRSGRTRQRDTTSNTDR